MKNFTFRIVVKKYIKKYLTTIYGETIHADTDTDIGFVVLNILASRIEAKVCRGYNKYLQNQNTDILNFTVPFHYYYCTKKELSIYTGILLNRYFENKFQADLEAFMKLRALIDQSNYKDSVLAFAAIYNIEIEEDISFDGLKKIEYRIRKKNLDNSLRTLSPQKNLFSQQVA